MKILITGGSGYIGSLLLGNLLAKGNEVLLLDNFSFGIKSILHLAHHKNLKIIEGDVRDKEIVKQTIKNADIIIHLAAIVGFPACAQHPNRAQTTNVTGSKNIVDNLSTQQQVIFTSTGSTYGKIEGICTEDTPIAPLTLYGSTKSEAEKLFLDKKGVALRFATVFGVSPRLRLDLLINDFVYQALHSKQIILYEGHFQRTFLHVADAVKSIEFSIQNYSKMKGMAFNIGDDSMNYTKKEIALLIKKKLDYYLHEAEVGKDMDQRDYKVSYKKIQSLGYKSTINIDEGIEELIKVLKHLKIKNEWTNI